jgi:hypothetical protein
VEQPKPEVQAAPAPEATAAPAPTPEKPAAEPASETRTAEPVAAPAQTAGITPEAEEFIRAQAEKYRDDKNRKQLVYRAVVKKFGQKTGTQIYNSAKKLLLK